jgi:hypothetical protein
LLAFKITIAPLLIAAVSVAGQRFGAMVAGLLSGFPIISGPIFVFLTLEHGSEFGSRAAIATLAGLASFAVFALTYAWTSKRWPWPLALLGGWSMFFASSLALIRFEWSLPLATTLAAAALGGAYYLLPHIPATLPPPPLPRSEIVLRMLAGAALVVAVTWTGDKAGARLAGLFTPFPVAGSVLAACSHRVSGNEAAVRLLRGMLAGLVSLAAFFYAAALLVKPQGLAIATAGGLAAAVLIQTGLLKMLGRR